MNIVDDDNKDKVARRKAFESTWKKADKGLPVVGATRLSELVDDPEILRKLYMLLSDNPDIAILDEFVGRFAIWKGPAVAIDLDQIGAGHPKPFMSRQNFASSYGHMFVKLGTTKRLLPEMLWSLKSAQRVDGLTFEPGQGRIVETRQGDKINQWSGFAIPPHPKEVKPEEISPFLDYLYDIVCDQNEKHYNWVLAWLADVLKDPANKCGTALVLVGIQGAGKSILGHRIMGPIIGETHYSSTNSVEAIVQKFNVSFSNRILIQCDEAINNRQRSVTMRLRSYITDPTQEIEPKGIDSYTVPNHTRLLFTSNDVEDALYLNSGSEDRRYTVLEVSGKKAHDIDGYWVPFIEWLDEEENLAKIHRFLIDGIYEKKLISRPLSTKAKTVMQQSSWESFDGWLASMVNREFPLTDRVFTKPYQAFVKYSNKNMNREKWPRWVDVSALLEDFKEYARSSGHRNAHLNEGQIRQKFHKLGLVDQTESMRVRYTEQDQDGNKTLHRPRVYNMPSIERIEKYLNVKHGFNNMAKDGIEVGLDPTIEEEIIAEEIEDEEDGEF